MPRDEPSIEQLWEGGLTFFSLDTDVIQAAAFNFSRGTLHQLPKQLPTTMHLLMTEVVCWEIDRHRNGSVRDAIDRFENACESIGRHTGFNLDKVKTAFERMGVAGSASIEFERQLKSFIEACRGKVLKIAGRNAARDLFDAYFQELPPFENRRDKKSEFPDAMSLWLLEQYAIKHDTLGIVVSGDEGWGKFADRSDRIYRVASVEALARLFAATDEHSKKLATLVESVVRDRRSALSSSLQNALEDLIQESEWDTSEIYSHHRVESEVVEATLKDFSIIGRPLVWPPIDGGTEWVIELDLLLVVDVELSSEFFIWDGVDREEISFGFSSDYVNETVQVRAFMNCMGVRLGAPPEQWNIDFDFSSRSFELSPAEIDMDFGP